MTQPKLITKPFADDALPGYVNEIPKDNPVGAPEQNASWALGFPPITMTDIDDGGLPPNGEDMNGVLRAITEHNLFIGGGGVYEFTDEYISEVGGYSKGAVLISDDKTALWMSIQDNNTQNFNGATKNQWRLVVSADLGSTLASIQDALNTKADKSVTITAGDGLTGGGTLAGNRVLAVNNSVVRTDRTITAGTGLSGGGNLSANRTLSVNYGTTAGTAAQGNDVRLSDARDWSATVVSQAEAEAGTHTTARKWTSQRVRQAIIATFTALTTPFSRTLISRDNAALVRNDLELGSAATENTGYSDGNVMVIGPYSSAGLMSSTPRTLTGIPSVSGFFVVGKTWIWSIAPYSTVLVMKREPSRSSNLVVRTDGGSAIHAYTTVGGSTEEIVRVLYDDKNTTVGAGGALFASSPVINLYTDHHDLHNEEQFGGTPVAARKSKGVYEITGTLGLRSEGWYLDTPNDRNGNKYFNVEWTQNITPTAVDGIVDEYRDDIVVTIETFDRVWNKETGMFENGTPIDINELQDRFVQLRFNEIKVEYEELDDDHS